MRRRHRLRYYWVYKGGFMKKKKLLIATVCLIIVFLAFVILSKANAATMMTYATDGSGHEIMYNAADCSAATTEGLCCWDSSADKLYCGTGAAAQEISAASMTMGNAVTGGTTGSIPYINSSGQLAQENATLNYDPATNTLTTDIVTTTGSDPKATIPNADGPAALVDGDLWMATDVDAVGISDGAVMYYARPTKLKTCAGNCSPAVTELDAMIWVTAAGKVSLPAVAANIYGASACIYSTTAAAVVVDVNALDRIVLNGVALDDGDSILSASGAGDFICLIADSVAGWTTMGRSGVWTDNGAS